MLQAQVLQILKLFLVATFSCRRMLAKLLEVVIIAELLLQRCWLNLSICSVSDNTIVLTLNCAVARRKNALGCPVERLVGSESFIFISSILVDDGHIDVSVSFVAQVGQSIVLLILLGAAGF